MAITCWAPGCNHNNIRESCHFFRFPINKEDRQRWITLIRRDGEPGTGARLCSCHFRDGKKENGPEYFSYNERKLFQEHHLTPEKKSRKIKVHNIERLTDEIKIEETESLESNAAALAVCSQENIIEGCFIKVEEDAFLDSEMNMPSEPSRLLPETNQSLESDESNIILPDPLYLSTTEIETSRLTDRIYCRLCFKESDKDTCLPYSNLNLSYPLNNKNFKEHKQEEVRELQRMVKICLPFYDSLVFDPVFCNDCLKQLRTYYKFINQCRHNQTIIENYIHNSRSTEKIANMSEIVESKYDVQEPVLEAVNVAHNCGSTEEIPNMNETVGSKCDVQKPALETVNAAKMVATNKSLPVGQKRDMQNVPVPTSLICVKRQPSTKLTYHKKVLKLHISTSQANEDAPRGYSEGALRPADILRPRVESDCVNTPSFDHPRSERDRRILETGMVTEGGVDRVHINTKKTLYPVNCIRVRNQAFLTTKPGDRSDRVKKS